MKTLAALVLIGALTGCSTVVPVTARFPDPPGKLATTPCPPLKSLEQSAALSDVSRTVAANYSSYYECAVKLDAWREWYEIQKRIFENIK